MAYRWLDRCESALIASLLHAKVEACGVDRSPKQKEGRGLIENELRERRKLAVQPAQQQSTKQYSLEG